MNAAHAVQPVPIRRGAGAIWRAGILAAVVAAVANVAVWALSRAVFTISNDFPALANPVPAIMFTVIGALAATAVYTLINRRARRPERTFRLVALGALLLSFLPDIALLTSDEPGVSAAAVGTLMVMHIVAAAVVVWLLTRPAQT